MFSNFHITATSTFSSIVVYGLSPLWHVILHITSNWQCVATFSMSSSSILTIIFPPSIHSGDLFNEILELLPSFTTSKKLFCLISFDIVIGIWLPWVETLVYWLSYVAFNVAKKVVVTCTLTTLTPFDYKIRKTQNKIYWSLPRVFFIEILLYLILYIILPYYCSFGLSINRLLRFPFNPIR